MDSLTRTYHALSFDDIGSAVDFCQSLVAHLAPRSVDVADPPIVWFHVPARSADSARPGCYLFANDSALAAARRGGLEPTESGRFERSALPPGSVLLFGEDAPAEGARTRRRSHRVIEPALSPPADGGSGEKDTDARIALSMQRPNSLRA